jgi:hypothetical protein
MESTVFFRSLSVSARFRMRSRISSVPGASLAGSCSSSHLVEHVEVLGGLHVFPTSVFELFLHRAVDALEVFDDRQRLAVAAVLEVDRPP